MDAIGLFILWLLSAAKRGSTAPSTTPSVPAADAAKNAADAAAKNPSPANLATSAEIAKKAADIAVSKSKAATTAAKTPPPWPTFVPPGLPAFPGGWEPDQPPPKDVVARAWQLLPSLWASGVGTRTTEFVGGRWITFVAAQHAGGKRGVTAYRIKSAAKAA